MKTLFTLMLSLLCMIAVGNEPSTTSKLALDGEYLSERNIKCEVYQLNADGTAEITETVKTHRYFSIKLDAQLAYVVKFTSKDGKIKYLYIPEAVPGDFMFDVDFRSKSSATLNFDQKSQKLKLTHTATKNIPLRNEQR